MKRIINCLVLALFLSLLSACTRRHLPEGTIVQADLAYVTNGHELQKLDLYLPADAGKKGRTLPLIIIVHGGAFHMGSRKTEDPSDYLKLGFAVAAIDYRLSQHAIFPAQIEDCKAAVRFLRANADKYNLDPNRFGAYGGSAGGYLVAMLGTTSRETKFDVGENLTVTSQVQAVVDFFGMTDFSQMDAHRMPDGQIHDVADSPESRFIGGVLSDHPETVQEANPVRYVSRDAPPFLIVHGKRDPLVPYHQSEMLVAALQKAGVPVTFYTVKDGGHGHFTDPGVFALPGEFFAKHLKP